MTRAQSLRKQAGDAEKILWRHLRNRRFLKYKFRRQHPIEQYVLDFYCPACRLAIELDGGGHNESAKKRRDAKRTEFLNKEGIEVLRFWNHMVLREIKGVLGTVDVTLQKRSRQHPSP
jgi:very-short-patch-repair endonuclease